MVDRTIGNATYRADKLPAVEGLRLLARLTKIFGPAIGELESAFGGDESKRDQVTMRAIAAVIREANEDSLVDFVVSVTSKVEVKVNGQWEPIVFDHHFEGDLMSALKVAIFALEVQFGDFFGAAKQSGVGRRILSAQPAPN